MKKHFLILLPYALLISAACTNHPEQTNLRINPDSLWEAAFEDELRLNPLTATSLGDTRYDSILPNTLSQKYISECKKHYQRYLTIIKQLDTNRLTREEYLNYRLFKYNYELQLEGLRFHDEYLPVDQLNGIHWFMPQMGSGASIQPFNTYKDYTNFLYRIDDLVSICDTAIANMKKGMALGYVKPKCVMEKTLPQLKQLIQEDPKKSIYYQPVLNFPKSFTPQQQDTLKKLYTIAIKNKIFPLYKKLHDFIEKEYLPECSKNIAITSIPEGLEEYRYLVKMNTTTNLTPDSIFNTGLAEVARIEEEMDKLRRTVKFNGDLRQFISYMQIDRRFYPFTSADEVIKTFNQIHDQIKPQLSIMFNKVPKAGFEVRQTEKFRENTESAQYVPPTPDGKRAGIFYVPVPSATNYNATGMQTLFLHEAIPGHHYQIALQFESTNLPKFRRFSIYYMAYIEGWALYAETLGKDLGLFRDPYQYFGHLSGEMLRAVRLVIDVGIHTKGWSREQAMEYLKSHVISTDQETEAAIDRYIVWPGQALAYKIGSLKIQELRKKAEMKLDKNFNLAEFHDKILENGPLPLELLEQEIEYWINEKLKKATNI